MGELPHCAPMPGTDVAVMPTDTTVWAGHVRTRVLPATLTCQTVLQGTLVG